jgi:hypothetical protein
MHDDDVSTLILELANSDGCPHALLLACWASFSHPHGSPYLASQIFMGFYGHKEKNRGPK